MKEAPLIGITTTVSRENVGKPDELELIMVGRGYVNEIIRAGGIPILLPHDGGEQLLRTALPQLDGVLFSGGEDISPHLYGEEPEADLGEVNPARDDFELALFRMAAERGLPVLAICRGMQLVNVALGGTLVQHIKPEGEITYMHHDTADTPRAWTQRVHEVHIEKDTQLAHILRVDSLQANSLHHQAVKDLGAGLAVSARSPDGVTEGIESTTDHWLVGVQWHPEVFEHEEGAVDRRLFYAFVIEARKHMQKK